MNDIYVKIKQIKHFYVYIRSSNKNDARVWHIAMKFVKHSYTRILTYLLNIQNLLSLKQIYIQNLIRVYISFSRINRFLIEPCSYEASRVTSTRNILL